MVDIDPSASVAKYTPRNTTLVDAVAEAKRIADQSLRSNPLKNARIDSGLTLWRGNYGSSLVWIGEIGPADQNLEDNFGNKKLQRAFVLQRDDPGKNFAITMYDPFPEEGVPLKQKMYMYDVNGKFIYVEGNEGGITFPDRAIPLYPTQNIEGGLTNGTFDTVWWGAGNITGTNLQFHASWAASGTVTVQSFVRVTGIGGTVIDSPTLTLAGPQIITIDIDISTIYADQDFINVDWITRRSAGTGSYYPRPIRVRNFSL